LATALSALATVSASSAFLALLGSRAEAGLEMEAASEAAAGAGSDALAPALTTAQVQANRAIRLRMGFQ
jgi:hypothetical protein